MKDNFKHQGRRKNLVKELKLKGIINNRVLEAIEKIPRHLFIDPGLSEQAYLDKALPIANNQTISQPFTVAFQTQLLDPKKDEKILEIGTGSGYQTAILNFFETEIYTIERDHKLFRDTSNLFKKLNIKPKKIIYNDGYKGNLDDSPYDGIIVTAGSIDVPKNLLTQLKQGGRLIIPIGKDIQTMTRITRLSSNNFRRESFGNFKFVPMLKDRN
jgi:protein-L-isoaspartate(D-aspartate) O-methyltransferase